MNCPKDGTAMRERERELGERQVVVMDVCPNCGGIWLDKGELEQLTESESRFYARGKSGDGKSDDQDDDDDEGHGGRSGHGGGGRRGRRREGFLGNLFDFGD